MEIKGIIKFIQLVNQMRDIERVILLKNSDRFENDAEHSYQLAMCAWYIITTYKLPLNVEAAIKYGLVHDLVEIHAGDVFFYDQMDPLVAQKKQRLELEAVEKLKQEFVEFPEMSELIEGYQSKKNEESKFVYALDKLISPINIYLDGGRIWHKHNISLKKLYDNKKPKTEIYPEVAKYFDQLAEILKQDTNLFPKEGRQINVDLKKEVEGYSLYGEKISIPVDKVPFRPSSYGLVVDGGKIALVKSKSTGRYFFPGGGVDPGETMEEAMRREVKEETGLEIITAELVDANDIFFEYTPSKHTFHSIQFFYLCTVNATELIDDDKVEDGEAETPRWVEISSLKKEDFQEHGSNVIDRILQRISK